MIVYSTIIFIGLILVLRPVVLTGNPGYAFEVSINHSIASLKNRLDRYISHLAGEACQAVFYVNFDWLFLRIPELGVVFIKPRLDPDIYLYISYYLKRNRIEYYDRLMEVRAKGNSEQWVKFFLQAIYESAQDAIQTIEAPVKLHDRNSNIVKNTGKAAKTVMKVFNYLERSPIIEIKKASEELGISFNAAANAVGILVNLDILKQRENVQRNRVIAYEDYLQILRKDT